MNKKELIKEIISEDWRQIRIDGMLIEKRIEYEMILDDLINSVKTDVKEECAKEVVKWKFENVPKPFKKEMGNDETIDLCQLTLSDHCLDLIMLFDHYLDLIAKAIGEK